MKRTTEEYNKLLKRYYDGCKYMENPRVPLEEKEKWEPAFDEILKELNAFIQELKGMTKDEIMNGF